MFCFVDKKFQWDFLIVPTKGTLPKNMGFAPNGVFKHERKKTIRPNQEIMWVFFYVKS